MGRGGRRQRADLDRAEEGVEAAVEPVRARAARLGGAAQRVADPARELGVGAREQDVVEAVAGVQREQLEAGGDAVEAREVGEQGTRACAGPSRCRARGGARRRRPGAGRRRRGSRCLLRDCCTFGSSARRRGFRTPWPEPPPRGQLLSKAAVLRPKASTTCRGVLAKLPALDAGVVAGRNDPCDHTRSTHAIRWGIILTVLWAIAGPVLLHAAAGLRARAQRARRGPEGGRRRQGARARGRGPGGACRA